MLTPLFALLPLLLPAAPADQFQHTLDRMDEAAASYRRALELNPHYAEAHCNLGMLLARTNPEVPKHQGITYFAIEMIQSGVDIRPLKEMTGRALFNEVFMTDARVANDALIGGENNGWAVANTTLANERAGLGSGGGSGAGGAALPGTVGSHHAPSTPRP